MLRLAIAIFIFSTLELNLALFSMMKSQEKAHTLAQRRMGNDRVREKENRERGRTRER